MRKRAGRLLRRFLSEARVRRLKDRVELLIGPEYLHMLRADLAGLPPARIPAGFRWKKNTEGRQEDYLHVMRRSLVPDADESWFGRIFSADPEYDPADLLIVCRGEEPVAAAAAWRRPWKGRAAGLVHMVGVAPECRGQGVGRALVLGVLHRLRDKGFREALLLTEDFRIPALSLYLCLGFRPVAVHWAHRLRWKRVLRKVAKARGART